MVEGVPWLTKRLSRDACLWIVLMKIVMVQKFVVFRFPHPTP